MNVYRTLAVNGKEYGYYALDSLGIALDTVPFSLRILLESVVRNVDGFSVTEDDVNKFAAQVLAPAGTLTIPFKPARVILQDFTGVPCVVDLAAMRAAVSRNGGDPKKINPLIPVDLVIDHSIQTDYSGTPDALQKNTELELQRNQERYELLHWAQKNLDNFRVVPPGIGIIHQVNLEFLASVVVSTSNILYPDSCLGTDSHTVMVNGLGVLGWGVGGIEAEAVMLGQPYSMLVPDVIGVELTGKLNAGVLATDLVLTLTEVLRKEGVVGKFVEYFGEGAAAMPVADRAVIANMAPEYGATMGYFPVDDKTLQFLRDTGRSEEHIHLVETYCRTNHLFDDKKQPIRYTKTLSLDLSTVEPCVAGPKRPQDRVLLKNLADKQSTSLPVVIAAITSCTNTSNPNLMLAAGLLAKKAVERNLKVPSWVKTSLSPGSRVVTDYLQKAGLLPYLEQLGFNVAGYGCMTCIGNSGPLKPEAEQAIREHDVTAAAVLSGNRNFEGRIHPLVKANYLASPPLVVAFALAGTMNTDLTDIQGCPLKDLFPAADEIAEVAKTITPEIYRKHYAGVCDQNTGIQSETEDSVTELFAWNPNSTYIQEPPFFHPKMCSATHYPLRVLAHFGDSVTTDHISPAGSIKKDSPAGRYLQEQGVEPQDFNSYGSRRGNDRVMVRGTFANVRIRNKLVPNVEGGFTRYFSDSEREYPVMSIYDAAVQYGKDAASLVLLAGKEYGTGSSRDWAAKGTALLGVKAVIAESFERIHRGNLVGMGVLPLEFMYGANTQQLGLTGEETFRFLGDVACNGELTVIAEKPVNIGGREMLSETEFKVRIRIDTPVELEYYRSGGILPAVLKKMAMP